MRAWRIVKASHAATAFEGEGARLFGGRWNSPGTRIVYTSGTQALATLESLVHLIPPITFKFVAISVDFEAALVETVALADLPADWTEAPPPPFTQRIGDQWVKQARSAVLEVPSVIIQSEPNYLLNPAHPEFKKVAMGKPSPFSFDPRML